MENKIILKRIRILILFFIVPLVLSGITAFPIETELSFANKFISKFGTNCALQQWINTAAMGVNETYLRYPFIAYGTDWLAFAHIVIAIAFIGPFKDPVKNIWVIEFGMIACISIIPLAMIAGQIRGIPFFWRLIDCSFGIFGIIPLFVCHKYIKQLEKQRS
jgi:hypothetical protein